MPVASDPFAVSMDVKAAHLLAVNEAAMKNGAISAHRICILSVRRSSSPRRAAAPFFSGGCQQRDILRYGRGQDQRQVHQPRQPRCTARRRLGLCRACDLVADAAQAGAQVREKLAAQSVEPGSYDVVIDPTNCS